MPNHSSIVLWRDLFQIADKVCAQFNFTYGKIVPETRKLARCYGETRACNKCRKANHINELNCREKVLYIRIHCLHKPNKSLAPSTILRTLAHELAHLREWYHGPAHRRLEREILDFIKEIGYEV
jgi:hypothetical protein